MPELPEVETVRRGLAPHLEGARIARIALNRDGLRWPFPPDLAQVATGARIAALRRRAKYILADLDRSDARGPVSILIHLGMSGRMLVEAAPPPACGGGAAVSGGTGRAAPGVFHRDPGVLPRHDHVVIETEAGARVVLNDARRFGMVDLVRGGQSPLLAGLGPEPLDDGFDGATLHAAMSGRRAPVKAMLLDQRVVAGLGNIYVAEALHRAGIDPRRAAGRISRPRLDRLAVAIRAVLLEAIAAGGSSLRDHRQATGELGYFQHSFRVYDREGAPCPTPGCSGVIRRLVQGGRSSFHCPRCQR